MSQLLQQIQQMQFAERGRAEILLREFISTIFPLDIKSVTLRPQAVSLNSFNGFLELADGSQLFFKTHTEEDNQLDEYYNASMLAEAGYPVIKPLYSSTKADQHLLIYEVVESPSVFDVAWNIEQETTTKIPTETLRMAQHRSDIELYNLYMNSLEYGTDTASAPIHQLFYNRLMQGRSVRFYGNFVEGSGNPIELVSGVHLMSEIAQMKWVINGQVYRDSLSEIMKRATRLLKPTTSEVSIIGHGDAHNGNVFLIIDQNNNKPSLTYFDPAFAGRHNPLLDLAKPLFHNVFAMWMYHPNVKSVNTNLEMTIQDHQVILNHDYDIHPIRHMFLESKVEHTLIPILQLLKHKGRLRDDWRDYLKSALFCCPFLTLNLADQTRFIPKIATLGLSMCIEMGAESSQNKSLIDKTLDRVEAKVRQ